MPSDSKLRTLGPLLLWAAFHGLIAWGFGFLGPYQVNTSLYAILPPRSDPHQAAAEAVLDSRLTGTVTALVGHAEWPQARQGAEALAAAWLQTLPQLALDAKVDEAALSELKRLAFETRHALLSSEVRDQLKAGQIEALTDQAFADLFSPVSLGALDRLDLDPFLLSASRLRSALAKGFPSVELREGYLTLEAEGLTYILLRAQLAGGGFGTEVEGHPALRLRQAAEELQLRQPGLQLLLSGVPLHSQESAARAQSEITLLGILSLVAVSLLALLAFRSPIPLAATFSAVVLSILTGLGAAFSLFRELHLFTVVFGTSLIGISVDYSFHFFSEWASATKEQSARASMRQVLPGITAGLLTTLISYAAFLLTGFPLLQEMSVFSMAGLISTWLSVWALMPWLPRASERVKARFFRLVHPLERFSAFCARLSPKLRLGGLGVLALGALGLGLTLRPASDLRTFYRPGVQLAAWEKGTAALMRSFSSGQYVLVQGSDLQNALEREEALVEKLEVFIAQGSLGAYTALSSYIPSARRQRENRALVKDKLGPWIPAQLEALGFEAEVSQAWQRAADEDERRLFLPEDLAGTPLEPLAGLLLLGSVGESWYTAVLLQEASPDVPWVQELSLLPGVQLVNRIEDTNQTLDHISRAALTALMGAYLLIAVFASIRYGWRSGLKIVVLPALGSVFTAGLLTLFGLSFNIFMVMGLLLVPGMGSDYVIFLTEGRHSRGPILMALALSLVTTLLAFGLLGFTALAGTFGLTVGLGVFFSFILALVFGPEPAQNQVLGAAERQ